jgi:hypothetical protein
MGNRRTPIAPQSGFPRRALGAARRHRENRQRNAVTRAHKISRCLIGEVAPDARSTHRIRIVATVQSAGQTLTC